MNLDPHTWAAIYLGVVILVMVAYGPAVVYLEECRLRRERNRKKREARASRIIQLEEGSS